MILSKTIFPNYLKSNKINQTFSVLMMACKGKKLTNKNIKGLIKIIVIISKSQVNPKLYLSKIKLKINLISTYLTFTIHQMATYKKNNYITLI